VGAELRTQPWRRHRAGAEVARDITGHTRVALAPKVQKQIARVRPHNLNAYNAYLLAQYFHHRYADKANLGKANTYYEQAIKLEPDYAAAWSGLASLRLVQTVYWETLPKEEGSRKTREAAQRALELDPNLAEAYESLASLKLYYDWDWTGADTAFQQALTLDPGSAEAMRGSAWLAATHGRFEEALTLSHRAVELDPLNIRAYLELALHATYVGRFEEAVAACNKVLELDPVYPRAHYLLGRVYFAQLHLREGLGEWQREPDGAFRAQGLALAYYALGQEPESDAALSELISKFQTEAAFQVAEVYAFRGEAKQAFDWLERAYSVHDLILPK